ncbi:hypothetical protein QSJ19_01195 [Gordonia sp. ABSL11-1]|uniref:hypothetical protein n=1 Tax=Gordonia sp. ABSL11-1 TaxID=3053924 RepID=UPI002574181D|nr:hypothetical protein [Gordonia sp. ABSL11-1]MDL9944218.1 hypothetical protein [Gordonia sp. ABSL11-1]
MALADRFPVLGSSHDDDWLPPRDATASNLVSAARRSLVASMRDIEPGAALPFGVDIRFIGSSTREGSLPADASPIIAAIQAEVRAAMPKGDVSFQMTGISEGSAVVRIEPSFAHVKEPFESAATSDLESALKAVIAVHELLERHAAPQEIASTSKRAVLDKAKELAEQLIDVELDLDLTASGSHGDVYQSKFTRDGGSAWIEHVYEVIDSSDQPATISGKLVVMDGENRSITVRGGRRGGRVEITNVPSAEFQNLAFDSHVNIRVVETATKNRLGRRTVTGRRFSSIVSDDPDLNVE